MKRAIHMPLLLPSRLRIAVFQDLSAQFKRLAARRGVKRAVMAVAHTRLVIGYHLLKTGQGYHELGGDYLERINKHQLQRYYVKRLQRLGLAVTIQPATATA